jgi:hypothetical protein
VLRTPGTTNLTPGNLASLRALDRALDSVLRTPGTTNLTPGNLASLRALDRALDSVLRTPGTTNLTPGNLASLRALDVALDGGLARATPTFANASLASPFPAFGNPYSGYPSNPYIGPRTAPASTGASAANGYGAAGGSSGGGAGYGSGSGGSASGDYGSATGSANPYLSPGSLGSTSSYGATSASYLGGSLDGLGLPTEGGRLNWPLGLRMLAPATKAQALRQQLEGLLRTTASQSAYRTAQPATLAEATRVSAELRILLRQSGSVAMADHTLREARHFLDLVDTALRDRMP